MLNVILRLDPLNLKTNLKITAIATAGKTKYRPNVSKIA